LEGISGLSFDANADTNAIATKRQISEKITSERREAKNILKKLLILVLIRSKVKEFYCRFYNLYTKRLFLNSNSLWAIAALIDPGQVGSSQFPVGMGWKSQDLTTPFWMRGVFSLQMNEVYLLTGGNIGDRLKYLSDAKAEISKRCGTILQESSVYETAAWGNEEQEAFLNQVLKVQTEQTPGQVLHSVLQIEEDLGRKRSLKYGPRTIDIDILFFNEEVVQQPGLTIPHPQIQNRRFVLVPLGEIAPEKIHPVLNKAISQLLSECPDPLTVNKFY